MTIPPHPGPCSEGVAWKRGLPPGPATPEALAKYEVYFSPGGVKWHRARQAATLSDRGA